MSHYTVLIIGDNPEEQLAPFCEQTEDQQYLEFFDAEKEYQVDYESGNTTKKEWLPSDNMWLSHKEYRQLLNLGELSLVNHAPDRYFCGGRLKSKHLNRKDNVVRIDTWDKEKGDQRTKNYAEVLFFKSELSTDIGCNLEKENIDSLGRCLDKKNNNLYVYTTDIKLIDPPSDIPLKDVYSSFFECLEERWGYEKDFKKGKYGLWKNPNAKWDWYTLGGRWCDFFTLKNGTSSDQIEKREIDFEAMLLKQRKEAVALWDETKKMLATALKEGKDIESQLAYGYDREKDDTLDSYIKKSVGLSTFAVLKDGNWYEKGKMGWWGCVSDEKDSDSWDRELVKLIKESPEDTLFSLYDCHI